MRQLQRTGCSPATKLATSLFGAALAFFGSAGTVQAWTYPIGPYIPGSYGGRVFGANNRHLGEDVTNPPRGEEPGQDGAPVRAIGDGWVKIYRPSNGYGQLVVVIEHDLGRPYSFPNYYGTPVETSTILSIYGHLRSCQGRDYAPPCTDIPYVNDPYSHEVWVPEGKIIGYVNNHPYNGAGYEHLHFGIGLSSAAYAASQDPTGWFRGYIWRIDEFGNTIRCPNECEKDYAAGSDVLRILGATTLISDANNDVYLLQGERVYHVLSAGVLEAMKNAEAPGWDWPSGDPVSLSEYELGPGVLVADRPSDGLLIRPTGANEVYMLQNGRKRWIQSVEAVNWIYGGTWMRDDVIEVPPTVISAYLPSVEGRQIWGVGEGETNTSIKNLIVAAYKTNANASKCGTPPAWRGWTRDFSGCLDFPITRVAPAYNSGASGISGKYQTFGSENLGNVGEKGTINYSSRGTFAVHGAIYQRYKSMDFSRSALGFPIANEEPVGSRRRSRFEGGSIYWDPATNQTTVEFDTPTTRTLNVLRTGSGSGLVTSVPGGIYCGSDCAESYPDGESVILSVKPTNGSTFGGWSGGCSGYYVACVVNMTAAKSVTATFNPPPQRSLSVSRSGTGTVSSSPGGIYCGSDCFESYPDGTPVILTATTSGGWTFGAWGGACSGNVSSCTLSMTAAKSVTATFNPQATRTLTVSTSGNGTVASNPVGINCGSDCIEDYPDGNMVFLIATPAAGSTFRGWSGSCSGNDTVCSVTMNATRSVNAIFDVATGGPEIQITSPGSGDSWVPGTMQTIRWTSSGLDASGVVKVYYKDHDNDGWRLLANLAPSATSYNWNVPMTPMRTTVIFVGNAVNRAWEEGWDLADFAISSSTVPLYRITVQNLTRGQALTSPLVVTHNKRVRPFRVNRVASAELQALAENGNYDPFLTAFAGDTNVVDFAANTTGPLVPGGDPAGTARRSAASAVLTAAGRRPFLSMASKLMCTNDGFTGFSRMRLPRRGVSVFLTKGYDAGTELDTEKFADIVPGCQSLIGVSSIDPGTLMTNPALAEGDTVRS